MRHCCPSSGLPEPGELPAGGRLVTIEQDLDARHRLGNFEDDGLGTHHQSEE